MTATRELACVRSAWPAPQFSVPVRDIEAEWLLRSSQFPELPWGEETPVDTGQMHSLEHLQRQGRLISGRWELGSREVLQAPHTFR